MALNDTDIDVFSTAATALVDRWRVERDEMTEAAHRYADLQVSVNSLSRVIGMDNVHLAEIQKVVDQRNQEVVALIERFQRSDGKLAAATAHALGMLSKAMAAYRKLEWASHSKFGSREPLSVLDDLAPGPPGPPMPAEKKEEEKDEKEENQQPPRVLMSHPLLQELQELQGVNPALADSCLTQQQLVDIMPPWEETLRKLWPKPKPILRDSVVTTAAALLHETPNDNQQLRSDPPIAGVYKQEFQFQG